MDQDQKLAEMARKPPTDPVKFKQWADRECVKWPGELQAKAYRAWAHGAWQEFDAAYAEWSKR